MIEQNLDSYAVPFYDCLNHKYLRSQSQKLRERLNYLESFVRDFSFYKKLDVESKEKLNGVKLSVTLTFHEVDPKFLERSINSCVNQSYENFSIVLINNGSGKRLRDYSRDIFLKYNNITLIETGKHLFNPRESDLRDPIPCFWNLGFVCTNADAHYFLAYDDYFSEGYFSGIAKLFDENPLCTSASGRQVPVDAAECIIFDYAYDLRGNRNRFESGADLCENYANRTDSISLTVNLFFHRTSVIETGGGYDNTNDLSQLMKMAVQGIVGYDPSVHFYWRVHPYQQNRTQVKYGLNYYLDYQLAYSNYDLFKIQENARGKNFATSMSAYYGLHCQSVFVSAVSAMLSSGSAALLAGARVSWNEGLFFKYIYVFSYLSIRRVLYNHFPMLLRRLQLLRQLRLLYRKGQLIKGQDDSNYESAGVSIAGARRFDCPGGHISHSTLYSALSGLYGKLRDNSELSVSGSCGIITDDMKGVIGLNSLIVRSLIEGCGARSIGVLTEGKETFIAQINRSSINATWTIFHEDLYDIQTTANTVVDDLQGGESVLQSRKPTNNRYEMAPGVYHQRWKDVISTWKDYDCIVASQQMLVSLEYFLMNILKLSRHKNFMLIVWGMEDDDIIFMKRRFIFPNTILDCANSRTRVFLGVVPKVGDG